MRWHLHRLKAGVDYCALLLFLFLHARPIPSSLYDASAVVRVSYETVNSVRAVEVGTERWIVSPRILVSAWKSSSMLIHIRTRRTLATARLCHAYSQLRDQNAEFHLVHRPLSDAAAADAAESLDSRPPEIASARDTDAAAQDGIHVCLPHAR